MMTNHDDHGDDGFTIGNDPLDGLLREWHAENAASAAAQRDTLMSAVAKSRLREQFNSGSARQHSSSPTEGGRYALSLKGGRVKANRFARFTPAIAASMAFAATLGLLFTTVGPHAAQARGDVIMAPDGGRLDAVNARGELIGPCPLKHTDVHVDVSGCFARVTLQQRYGNPYADKIEAVYTFPLSHRGAVDRMTMTIGDRVVVGEVKEREAARKTYEAAKNAGHAAALLEQERPNIFTQSVANIEPGVEIVVEISYVELLEARDGLFGFAFPMVVAPRYIPGGDDAEKPLPDGLQHREGLNLLAPASLAITANGDTSQIGALTPEVINSLITDAIPIEAPPAEYWTSLYPTTGQPALWHQFELGYMDGQREAGVLYTDGLGQINGRWFYINTGTATQLAKGTGSSPGSTQVPDAARITPQPGKPTTRAGHDISITVNIDTGGPGITDLKSESHAVQQNWGTMRTDGTPSQAAVSLNDVATIPNKDFVLHWRQTADTITEQVFTHADARGGFITLILNPPARVENTDAVPRELVFVLDTSGSMQGFPIEKAKDVMTKAIAALRPQDTFNVITFAGDTNILWSDPQPASPDKLAEAQQFVTSREGRGGTEMMTAINAALTVKPETLRVTEGAPTPVRIVCFLTDGEVGNDMAIIDAVKKNAATTRVFSFGIGNSVNRYLLDGIAKAGRGAAEYVLLSEGADEKVATFTQRIQSPVLMNVKMEFAGDIEVVDRVPEELPDLYDVSPVIVHARYTKGGKCSVTLRGDAGSGPYEKTIELDLPEAKAEHDVIATLWAREKVEQLMNRDLAAAQNGTFPDELKKQVIDLGERFQIMSQFTSFVAVENLRVTVGGQPRLVPVPIELPEGQSWEGTMGEELNKWADQVAPQDVVLLDQVLRIQPAMPQGTAALTYPNFGDDSATTTNEFYMYSDVSANAQYEAGMEKALQELRFNETQVAGGSGLLQSSEFAESIAKMQPSTEVDTSTANPTLDPAVREEHELLWQQAEKSYRVNEEKIKKAVIDYDFVEARQLMDSSDKTLESNRQYSADPARYQQFSDHAIQLRRYIDDEEKAHDESEIAATGSEIASREQQRAAMVNKCKRKQIEQLMGHANELRKERRYDDAVEVLKRTLAIDPTSQNAAAMKETLEDISNHGRERDANVRDGIEKTPPAVASADLLVETEEAVIPWHKDVLYPKNWAEITEKKDSATSDHLTASHSNREGNEVLYFERRPFVPFQFAGGSTSVAPILPQAPGQPPPESLGRQYQPRVYGMVAGKQVDTARVPAGSSERYGIANYSAAPPNMPPQGDTAGIAAAGETRLRVGYVGTPPPTTPGTVGQPTILGQAVQPTDPPAGEAKYAWPQPFGQPGVIPQAMPAQRYSRGRDHVYAVHSEAAGETTDVLRDVGVDVPITQAGQVGSASSPSDDQKFDFSFGDSFDAKSKGVSEQPPPDAQVGYPDQGGDGKSEIRIGSPTGDRTASLQGSVADRNGDGLSNVPFANETMPQPSKTPVLGDLPGISSAFQKTPPPAPESPPKRLLNISGSLGGAEPESVVACKGIDALLLEVVDDPDPVELGQEITYTLTVTNQGTWPYSNIAVSVALPESVRPVRSAGGPALREGQTIHFMPQATLDPKTRMQRTLTVVPVTTGDNRIKTYMSYAGMKGEPTMETESSNFYGATEGQTLLSPEAIANLDRLWVDTVPAAPKEADKTEPDHASNARAARTTWRLGNSTADQMLVDQLLVRSAALAQSGRLDAATAVSAAILEAKPDDAPAKMMQDVLNCYVITNESSVRRLCELAAPSARRLTASAERARLMARRLDERLLRLALADKQPVAPTDASANRTPRGNGGQAAEVAADGLDITDRGVLVSVLVDAFGDGTVAALTKSGLKIESTSKPTRVVIGRVDIKHLADLATSKHVRKIEAVKVR